MSEDASKIDGLVAIGISKGIEVTKIDSFTALAPITTQHEHLWTDEWIGPPVKPGS